MHMHAYAYACICIQCSIYSVPHYAKPEGAVLPIGRSIYNTIKLLFKIEGLVGVRCTHSQVRPMESISDIFGERLLYLPISLMNNDI